MLFAIVAVVAVSRSKAVVEIVPLSTYARKLVPLELAGVRVTCGAAPKAALNVIAANLPPVPQLVPVVTVMVPLVSFPAILTVGLVQAAAPAAIVGVEPLVIT